MEIKRISPNEYVRKFGHFGRAITVFDEEAPVTYVPKQVGTRTKLHELYHTTSKGNWENLEGYALEELRAEEFANEKMGKELPYNSAIYVAQALRKRGVTAKGAFRLTWRTLGKLGYERGASLRDRLQKDIESLEDD